MLPHPQSGAHRGAIFSALLILLAGCGDDDLVADAGVADSSLPDASLDGSDGSDVPRVIGAPFVREALPEAGATNIEPETSLLVWFSEEMATDAGTITLQPGDIELDASAAAGGQWLSMMDLGFDDPGVNVAVLVTPPEALVGGVEYTASAQQDFTDVGGAPLDAVYDWTFQVNDMDPPFVVASTPEEGAIGLSARLDSIEVEFNEQIDASVSAFRLEGGPGILGEPEWDATSVTIPVTGIAYSQNYRLIFTGLVDESGNELDGAPYLIDGRLNFATGPDDDAPRVTSSIPTEGQRGANPATTTVRVEFDEVIVGTGPIFASFTGGMNSTEVLGSFDGERALVFEVSGLITTLGDYALDLSASGITDRNGTPLDLVSYLDDGAIDFEVGVDTFGPRVISTAPDEGATDVRFSRNTIRVRFDEPMNSLRGTAALDNGVTTSMIAATFSASNTIAEFNVAGRLQAGRAYALDLTSFQDAGGRALDGEAYLIDGVLNFTTQEPTGDSCREPLTALSAEETPEGGLFWSIEAGEYVDDGATDSCDTFTASDDVVIEYVKTSERLADGGSALAIDIVATGSDTTDINWELRDGVCEIPLSGDDEAQLVCHSVMQAGGRVLDVGPGTYYIWVAKDTTGPFPGADVTVTEVTAFPEGEGCDNPFSIDSPAGVYVAPRTERDPHTFQIPIGGVQDFDRDDVSNGPGNTSCADQHGADAVIRFTKSSGTILEIRAVPTDILSSAADINIEVSRGCDPSAPDYQSVACEASFDRPTTIAASAPAGDVFIWVSAEDPDDPFPGATVTVREIPVAEGESCGTARPITMSGPVRRDSSSNLGGGSCLGSAPTVTWYSYEPTENIVVVTSNVAGELLLQDQASNQPLACASDAQAGVAAVVASGSTLCIGIPSTALITGLTFEEQTYEGITGTITDLEFDRALSNAGTPQSWTGERWLRSTPTTLYMGESSRVFQINKRVGSQALVYTTPDMVTSSRLGYQAATVGERLFTVDDTTIEASNRVFELWDARTFPWSPTPWEDNPEAYGTDIRAIAVNSSGDLIVATHDNTAVRFFQLSSVASGSAVEIGSNDNINDVRSIAVDDTYFYIAGDLEGPSPESGAVARIPIVELGNPAFVPELLAAVTLDSAQAPIAIDSRTAAAHLYYRDVAFATGNRLGVIVAPGSATPRHLGTILSLGGSSDYSFTYDETDDAIYLFETQTESIGRIVRVD
ncbi:MAG: Ig-like domain-containing protein [Polyangiales bacterium]